MIYIMMSLVVPFANTSEEATRRGGRSDSFNAQEVIDRAKKHYGEFKDNKEWRRHWRQQRREWRRRWHEGAYWWGHNLQRNVHQFNASAGYGGHLGATLLIPFLAVFNAVLFCVWIAAISSLSPPPGQSLAGLGCRRVHSPMAVSSILILMVLYSMLSRPLRHARRAIYFNTSGHNYYLWFVAWYESLSTGVLIGVCWYAYTHVPQVHAFFQHFLQNVTLMWNNIVGSFHHTATPKPAGPGFDTRLPAAAAAASASAFLALRT